MSKGITAAIVLLLMLLISANSNGFETETHALITRKAFTRSKLADTSPDSVKVRLGLDRYAATRPFNLYWNASERFGDAYYTHGADEGTIADSGNILIPPAVMSPERWEQCQMQEFALLPDGKRNTFRDLFTDTVDSSDSTLPLQNWLVRGAIREDDLGLLQVTQFRLDSVCSNFSTWGDFTRVFNHFYDPAFDKGMPGCPPGSVCERTVAWALGNADATGLPAQEDTLRLNRFSYRDARNTMWAALTREFNKQRSPNQIYAARQREADSIDRLYLWATTFRSLGDVMHLLEDMGQPQHTRSDPHSLINTPEQQTFEGYTNARVLGGTTADGNSWVRGFFGETVALSAPPIDGYPVISFSTPLRFFTTQGSTDGADIATRAGLADYTNRGFFTGGTLPPDNVYGPHLYPPGIKDAQGTLINDYEYVEQQCPDTPSTIGAVVCGHYVHDVPDLVDHSGFADSPPDGYAMNLPKVPLAAKGILTEPIDHQGSLKYVNTEILSPVELDTIGNLTIPRAVGYAAGMLDFFFRGKLEVTAPVGGIYAIVNHGAPHLVDGNGVPYLVSSSNKIFGFDKVRLQVRNITDKITDAGSKADVAQTTGGTGAKLVAVAHYHRNPCYQPDLTGDISADSARNLHQPNCASYRTAFPEISVSAPVPVTLGMLDGQPIEQQFDFNNDPIPINATDVFIQVAYRGQLGEETDGIAVGMVDVSEPTYDGDLAMTDLALQYQEDGSTWRWDAWTAQPWSYWISPDTGQATSHAPPDPTADLALTQIEICSENMQVYHSKTAQLPSGHIVRIAMLRDFVPRATRMQVTYQGIFGRSSSVGSSTLKGNIRQSTMENGGQFTTNPLFWGRGVAGTGSFSYITTCAVPYPNNTCPPAPLEPPSPWDVPPVPTALPDIAPPTQGFVSENIGEVYLPASGQTPVCTIVGGGQPYSRVAAWGSPTATGQTVTQGAELR